MSSKYMVINRYQIAKGSEAHSQILAEQIAKKNNSSFYCSHEQDELVEFMGYTSLEEFTKGEQLLDNVFDEFKSFLSGDIKRELLKYVESPIQSETPVPLTKYVQLRHVEVLPSVYQAYLDWRDETIFNVVRDNKATVTSFDAYHSFISGVPGVMFISSFSCSVDEYLKPFTDSHYQDIVTQAGDSYITGGNEGLYTKIYKKLGSTK